LKSFDFSENESCILFGMEGAANNSGFSGIVCDTAWHGMAMERMDHKEKSLFALVSLSPWSARGWCSIHWSICRNGPQIHPSGSCENRERMKLHGVVRSIVSLTKTDRLLSSTRDLLRRWITIHTKLRIGPRSRNDATCDAGASEEDRTWSMSPGEAGQN
jgi:hypothetical protein